MAKKNSDLNSLLSSLSEQGLRYDLSISHPVKVADMIDPETEESTSAYAAVAKLEVLDVKDDGSLRTFRKSSVTGISKDPEEAIKKAISSLADSLPDLGFKNLK